MSKNNNEVKRYIRAIHFDLDTHALQEQYPTKNWRKAYDDIGDFLKSKGFVHRQGSGYISNEALSKYQVSRILRQMSQELSYLNGAVKTLDVDNIIEEKYNYGFLFEPIEYKSKSEAMEKADEIEKGSYMSDDKTIDKPQDKLTVQNIKDKSDKSETTLDCLFDANCNAYADDDELDLTGQGQSRGR